MQLSRPIYQLKRRAKLLARDTGIPLHEAQDRIAQAEGFARWSLLSAQHAATVKPPALLHSLGEGDLALLAARPGQGKTLAGLQLLIDAARETRRAVFFTLEYTEAQARDLLASIGAGGSMPEVVTDAIHAEAIIARMADAPRGSVAVVDYLQAMDQRRDTPPLADQIESLRGFARETGTILAFIAQVDRSFDPGRAAVPSFKDLRLPNPVPDGAFTKACFAHGANSEVKTLA
tara:strand:+ start:2183 stop:2881 length:699 start_codon:yes stop_codon:yes gene_type:complete